MVTFTGLPPEIIQSIAGFVGPKDLASLIKTCRCLRANIENNKAVHRAVYLGLFDEPPTDDIDWVREVQDLIQLEAICSDPFSPKTDGPLPLPFVHDTVIRLLSYCAPSLPVVALPKPDAAVQVPSRAARCRTYAPSRTAAFLADLFFHEQTRMAFLERSFLYERARHRAHRFPVSVLAYRIDRAEGEDEDDEHDVDNNEGEGSGSRADDSPVPEGPEEDGSEQQQVGDEEEEAARWRQMSAHLHSLFGTARDPSPFLSGPTTRAASQAHLNKMDIWARTKVYDLREHMRGRSGWGPFMDDGSGRVDWEKMEAVLLVLTANIQDRGLAGRVVFGSVWTEPFGGAWRGSYIPWPGVEEREKLQPSEEHRNELAERDPYGVGGTWLRVVSYLDYRDFHRWNFTQRPDEIPMPPLEQHVGEETRLLIMKLRVTKIEDDPNGGAWPVVHFSGFSKSLGGLWDENAQAELRDWVETGTVRMTPDGEARWTTLSIFAGEERWKSESVQLGGPKSARGVIGHWFDSDYSPRGPCGPTAFWKISDLEPCGMELHDHDFLPLLDLDEAPMMFENDDDDD